MTKLSVNIKKLPLRNSRGGKVPDLLKVATDIQEFGAQGITIHPGQMRDIFVIEMLTT